MRVDLSANYLGMQLSSPLVASASPCTGQPDVLRQLEDCGAGAAVLPSLFEEQVGGAVPTFAFLSSYNSGDEYYPRLVQAAKSAVNMPIIGSINAATPGGWVSLARQIEQAGADALELNLYHVAVDRRESAADVESRYLDIAAEIRDRNDIPLAIKLGPSFTALPHFARRMSDVAADGLVLFNRFLEPSVDLEQGRIEPHLELSTPHESRLAIRWIGILRDQLPEISLAASGGFHNAMDALRALAVGADVVMVTSALLRHGVEHLNTMRMEMVEWLANHEYAALGPLLGSLSRGKYNAPEMFDRANYARTLASFIEQDAPPGAPR